MRTADDQAHGPRQDPVASLAWRHLSQHGHGDGLDVESKGNGADRGRKGDCTADSTRTHTLCPLSSANLNSRMLHMLLEEKL